MTEPLSALGAVLLEKAAVDCGFELERPRDSGWLHYASTHATLDVWLTIDDANRPIAAVSRADVAGELAEFREPGSVRLPNGAVAARAVADVPALHRLLRRAFQLARSLPDAMLQAFRAATATLPRATEAERLVVQRVGQDVFRNGLLNYWDGKCAVTGLGIPELLRASHIKPWAACDTDAERLDVFNGLLLAPQWDAALDRGFATVADDGRVVLSAELTESDRRVLGIVSDSRARIANAHNAYLAWHREKVFRG